MDFSVSNILTYFGLVNAGIAIGIVLGRIIAIKSRKRLVKSHECESRSSSAKEENNHQDDHPLNDEDLTLEVPYKLVLVIPNDLKMGKGKAAVQCAHASVLAYKKLSKHDYVLKRWKLSGQKTVAVKVDNEQQLEVVKSEAQKLGISTCVIRDAGKTQVFAGRKTVLSVGPAPCQLVDKITGHFKLY